MLTHLTTTEQMSAALVRKSPFSIATARLQHLLVDLMEPASYATTPAPPSNTTVELVGGNNTKEGNVLLNGSPIW